MTTDKLTLIELKIFSSNKIQMFFISKTVYLKEDAQQEEEML